MNKYPFGQQVRITATFTNLAGAAVNPTNVRLRIRNAGASEWTITPVTTGTGQYYADITVWHPEGRWVYRWEGDGTVGAALEGEFQVGPSSFT